MISDQMADRYREADRAAVRRIAHQLTEEPDFWEKMAARWVCEQIALQMPSSWLALADEAHAAGDFDRCAQLRIHAHLLAGGSVLDADIAAEVKHLSNAPIGFVPRQTVADQLLEDGHEILLGGDRVA